MSQEDINALIDALVEYGIIKLIDEKPCNRHIDKNMNSGIIKVSQEHEQ